MPTLTAMPTFLPTVLGLTVGNVDVSLDMTQGANVSYRRVGSDVVLQLEGFSGTLTFREARSNQVRDEPQTPERVGEKKEEEPTSPTQTKLSFGRKKRGNDAKATSKAKRSKKQNKKTTENQEEETKEESPKKETKKDNIEELGGNDEGIKSQEDAEEIWSKEVPPIKVQDGDDADESKAEKTSEKDVEMKEKDTIHTETEGSELALVPRSPSPEPDTESDPDAPCPRWGHSVTPMDDGKILVYGGQSYDADGNPVLLDDARLYDPKEDSWEVLSRGPARVWHAASYLPDQRRLVVTGKATQCYDTELNLWFPLATTGNFPERTGHSSSVLVGGASIVVIGGQARGAHTSTVFELNTKSWKWTKRNCSGNFAARTYHSAVTVGNQVVVFGGNNKKSCFDSVHVLDCETWKWTSPKMSSDGPSPRTGHVGTLLPDGNSILYQGGWDSEDEIFDDAWLLDTTTWTWARRSNGDKRCGHGAAWDAASESMITFGGRMPGDMLSGDLQRIRVEK